jgi:hypothetical protein
VSQFKKAALVTKLRRGREATGRCEGRKAVPEAVVAEACRPAEVTEDGHAA